MENQFNCEICNKAISTKNYAVSRHVKNHDLTLEKYVVSYYKKINGNIEKCGFCDNNAKPKYIIDHLKKEYSIMYEKGYSCDTIECKERISKEILGFDYNPKSYEKIGSKSEYLSRLYKIDIKDAKEMKYNKDTEYFDNSLESFIKIYGEEDGLIRYKKRLKGIIDNNPRNKFPCTLENFIKRYGKKVGEEKYKNRCEKISYTSSKDYFIEKYGNDKGNDIWRNKYKTIKTSEKSKKVSNILESINIKYEIEKNINGKFVDYYLPDYNIVIEYYGDYWHGNPKKYRHDYYISQLKMKVSDLWEKDSKRIESIKNEVGSIIIIWESTNLNDSLLEKYINDFKDKNTIIYL